MFGIVGQICALTFYAGQTIPQIITRSIFFIYLFFFILFHFYSQSTWKLIIVHVEIKIVNKEAATKRSTLLHAQCQLFMVAVPLNN